MMREITLMMERSDEEPRERQIRRLGARQLRARQREERRAEHAVIEIAWSRLC